MVDWLFASNAMNFGDWANAVQNIVQAAALIVGGLFAYYKFFRGKTFHRRAEVNLSASLVGTQSSPALLARAEVANTGAAEIPLDVAAVEVSSFRQGDVDKDGRPVWRDIRPGVAFELFRGDDQKSDHEKIESQETISDDVLVPLRTGDLREGVVAFRLTCTVLDRAPVAKKGTRWTTRTIIPATPKEDTRRPREQTPQEGVS